MEIASERYTKTCRWVLTLAHIQADEARATVITTEHMTAALAQETGCSAAKAMSRMGVDLESLKRAMLQEEDKPPTWIQPEFDEMAEAAITTAGRTARLMGDPQIVFSVNYFCRFRQLFLPVHLPFLTALLGHSGAVAGDVEF